MEADFKAKEQADTAILNTKKDWLKKQDQLQEQMKQLEEKVTYRPLFSVPLLQNAIKLKFHIASHPKTEIKCIHTLETCRVLLSRPSSTLSRVWTIRSPAPSESERRSP